MNVCRQNPTAKTGIALVGVLVVVGLLSMIIISLTVSLVLAIKYNYRRKHLYVLIPISFWTTFPHPF